MYHDQGLPVIKHDGFGHAVNVTLGLPILRTSVDHGTALTLARTGKADAGSLRAALALAIELAGTASCRSVSASASTSCTIPAVIRRIVDAVAPAAGERIVEIGPGRGALTWGLLERAKQPGCDRNRPRPGRRRCAPIRARGTAPARARRGCARDGFRALARRRARRCASSGNLPYNISTPLLFRLLAQRGGDRATCTSCCRRKSWTAWPRSRRNKEYGRLTVMLGGRTRRSNGCSMSAPAHSSRAPKVWSAVVRLRPTLRTPLRHRHRRRAAHPGHGRVLPPAQNSAQRL